MWYVGQWPQEERCPDGGYNNDDDNNNDDYDEDRVDKDNNDESFLIIADGHMMAASPWCPTTRTSVVLSFYAIKISPIYKS